MTLELLHAHPETARAEVALDALAQAAVRAGSRVSVTTKYAGAAPILLLWGPGAPDRIEAIRRQRAAGGHVIALDLAYWSRQTKTRVSFDGPHPQDWVMRRDWPLARFLDDPVSALNRWDPVGPVLVAGIGDKARVQYGNGATLAWEAAMVRDAAALYGLPVLYRAKREGAALPRGVRLAPAGPIERVLAGCSLVITWHSNVAIDAIRLNIPVVCRDGAAAAVCPSTLQAAPRPLNDTLRDRFLGNLAWFQWAPSEAAACWRWIRETLA